MLESPDYDLIQHLLRHGQIGMSASELHGSLSAQLSFDADLDPDRWLSTSVGSELTLSDLDLDLRQELNGLFDWTSRALQERELGLRLLLPDDDVALDQRTAAFAHWCAGFVAALGVATAGDLSPLPDEAREYVHDLVEMSRAEFQGSGEEDEEDEEAEYLELVEYARLGAMMIFETFRTADSEDTLH